MKSQVRSGLICLVCLLCAVLAFGQQSEADFNHRCGPRYDYFEVPGASSTTPTSINDSLTVTGTYGSADGQFTGAFVRRADGHITTFAVGKVFTGYTQINDLGEIAGMYQDVSGSDRGFLREPDGSIATFNPGGADGATEVRAINNRGTIVGAYSTTNSFPPAQAYVRTRDGVITTFSIPGSDYVYPWGINDLGEITGDYFYAGDTQVGGFVRSPGGLITTFHYATGIVPLAINRAGMVTGWYGPPVGDFQPFLRHPDGKIVPFTLPKMGAVDTQVIALNDRGFVAGSYSIEVNGPPGQGSEEVNYGFLRSPEGVITTFHVPGSMDTTVVAMNNDNVVIGTSDNKGAFLRIPDRW